MTIVVIGGVEIQCTIPQKEQGHARCVKEGYKIHVPGLSYLA